MGLTVAFDASSMAKPERTGIARYGTCLVDAILQTRQLDRCILGLRVSRWRRRRHAYRPSGAHHGFFMDAAPAILLGRFDVFHGLDARLPRRCARPMIATLHDVEQLAQPEIASGAFRRRKQDHLQRVADLADRVICVSTASKNAFRDRFGTPDARLTVIHHGLEPRFGPQDPSAVAATLDRLGIARPYVLFVGLISARKNLVRLVEGFERAASSLPPDTRMVLAGGQGHGVDDVHRAIAQSTARDRIHLAGFVSDADLPALYAGARAFAFPGLAEGFGLPMLEAMACGTPVIAAALPVSREVAGGAAILVDATDPDRIAEGLVGAVTEGPARAERVLLGSSHAARFSWRAAAEHTIRVYHEVIS